MAGAVRGVVVLEAVVLGHDLVVVLELLVHFELAVGRGDGLRTCGGSGGSGGRRGHRSAGDDGRSVHLRMRLWFAIRVLTHNISYSSYVKLFVLTVGHVYRECGKNRKIAQVLSASESSTSLTTAPAQNLST